MFAKEGAVLELEMPCCFGTLIASDAESGGMRNRVLLLG